MRRRCDAPTSTSTKSGRSRSSIDRCLIWLGRTQGRSPSSALISASSVTPAGSLVCGRGWMRRATNCVGSSGRDDLSGRWELAPPIFVPKQVRLVETTCDRCGEPSSIVNEPHTRAWGEAIAQINGDMESHHADLCQGCAIELKEWIDAGKGGGMVDGVAFANESTDYERRSTRGEHHAE